MDSSAAVPAPGAATIRAVRARVKLPLPTVADTGFGTTPTAGAALAAVRTALAAVRTAAAFAAGAVAFAVSARAAAGTPMTSAMDAANQPARFASLAGRWSSWFMVPASDP